MTGPPAPSGRFQIQVSGADGPRAEVPYPPFPAAVPVAGFDVVPLAGPPGPAAAVRVHLDCAAHPAAAAFLAAPAPGRRFVVFVGMQAHETGNGYVILAVRDRDLATDTTGDRSPSILDVVLDPIAHATLIDALVRTGFVRFVPAGGDPRRTPGWTLDVSGAALVEMTAQALDHPRNVLVRFGEAAGETMRR